MLILKLIYIGDRYVIIGAGAGVRSPPRGGGGVLGTAGPSRPAQPSRPAEGRSQSRADHAALQNPQEPDRTDHARSQHRGQPHGEDRPPPLYPSPLTPEIEHADPDRPFLKTEFNRDGDSYRSCLTNAYHPSAEGYTPSPQFRRAEEVANDLFAEYTKLYYGPTAVGSFFLTEGETANAFSCGYFAKKSKGLLR